MLLPPQRVYALHTMQYTAPYSPLPLHPQPPARAVLPGLGRTDLPASGQFFRVARFGERRGAAPYGFNAQPLGTPFAGDYVMSRGKYAFAAPNTPVYVPRMAPTCLSADPPPAACDAAVRAAAVAPAHLPHGRARFSACPSLCGRSAAVHLSFAFHRCQCASSQ